jgi:hypothetical protein
MALPIRYWARFERLTATRGIVTLHDERSAFAGAYRVERKRVGDSLYALAYGRADAEATLKGGRLESFREVLGD